MKILVTGTEGYLGFPGRGLSFGDNGSDNRSYRVSFEKIRQLHDLFERIDLTEQTFTSRGHTRLKQLEHLIRTGQIGDGFYWQEALAPEPVTAWPG